MVSLVADVGGTHVRFALAEVGADGAVTLSETQKLEASAFATPEAAAAHYLDRTGARPEAAALAVAGPVSGGRARLTNRDWTFDAEAFAERFGLRRVRLLNDFEAVAAAVGAFGPADLVPLGGGEAPPRTGVITVLGPGTGLGVALVDRRPGAPDRVIATEGGHAGFAPADPVEAAVAALALGRGERLELESLICGPGLARLHALLAEVEGRAPDAPVDDRTLWARAIEGADGRARAALERFCALLGTAAGDVALAHGSEAVVLAGGLVPRFLDVLKASAFLERFRDRGRWRAYMESISIFACVRPDPGLLGAARVLAQEAAR